MNDRPSPRDREAGLPPARPSFRPSTPSVPNGSGVPGVRPGLGAAPKPAVAGAPLATRPTSLRPAPAPASTQSQPPATDRPLRVLVVDDSVLMRQAVRRLLSADPGLEVVDIARDGLEALAKVEKLKPD